MKSTVSSNATAGEDDYDYSEWFDNTNLSTPTEAVELPCYATVDGWLYHTCFAAVSLAVILVLAAVNRLKKPPDGLHRGTPGLLSWLNFMDHTCHNGLPVAVFGLLLCELWAGLLAPTPLPFIRHSASENRIHWWVLALFYHPIQYLPLLLCGSLHGRVSHMLGTLLSWMHLSVLFWRKIDCPTTAEVYKYYSLLTSLPQLACLAYLGLRFPLLVFEGMRRSSKADGFTDIESNFYGNYVKKIFRTKQIKPSTAQWELCRRVAHTMRTHIYIPEKDFRCPTLLAVSSVVSFTATFQVTLLLITAVIPTLQKIRAGLGEDVSYLLAGFNVVLSENRAEVVKIVAHYIWCVEACYICATSVSCLITLTMLMKSMVLHRANLRRLYRGEIHNVHIRQRADYPTSSALVSWMRFSSFQAALTCLGLIIQTLVFFICFMLSVFYIIIPILYGQNLFIVRFLTKTWPFWLMMFLTGVVQYVTARTVFIKNSEGTRYVNHRCGLVLLTYLLFLVNILWGVLLGMWRLVITGFFNIIHLSRLDTSLLHCGVETFDPGFQYYTYYLRTEAEHNHPVMKAFCGILLQCANCQYQHKVQEVEEGIQLVQQKEKQNKTPGVKRTRMRWLLALTLINNPCLADFRVQSV